MRNRSLFIILFCVFLVKSENLFASHAAGMDLTYECLDSVFASVQVVVNTQAWGNECSWNITDANGNIVASGGGYADNNTYTIDLCLDVGNYTFNWYDSFGDGWNGGSYQVINNAGSVLTSGSPPNGASGSSNFTSPPCTFSGTVYPPDTYKVTVKFYRDCADNNWPAPGQTGFVSGWGWITAADLVLNYRSVSCNNYNNSQVLNFASTDNITPACATVSDPCNDPSIDVGVEEYVYETIITLPNNCTDWELSVCLANRNAAISTIQNPGNEELCITAELNNTLANCNSSPVFTEYPTPYICVNQPFCYNNGAVDPDGDSLVYSLVYPMTQLYNTGPVIYQAGYDPYNPVTGTTTFDTLTGDLCITATAIDVAILAMKVSEYRNGVFIGSVVRDIQVIMLTGCTNGPILTGLNGAPLDVTTAAQDDIEVSHCSNGVDPITRTVSATLGASSNKVMSWSGISPGTVNPATFTITGNNTNNPTGTFSWIPDYLDVAFSPFLFTVTVTDDACPINNTFSFTYTINLTSSSGFIVQDVITEESCTGNNDGAIDVTITGITGVPTFDWTGPNGFTANTEDISGLEPGSYTLQITAPDGCVTSYNYTVGTNEVILSYTTNDIDCFGANNGSIDLTVSGGTPGYTYIWNNTATTEDLNGIGPGNYNVTVTDAIGCSESINGIAISEPTELIPSAFISLNYNGEHIRCYGENNGEITANVTGGVSPYTYSINTGPPPYSYNTNNIFNSLAANTYIISYKDYNNCEVSENIVLTSPSQLQAFTNNVSDISCFNEGDGEIDILISGGTPFLSSPFYSVSWSGTNGFTSTQTNLLNIAQSGTYTATIFDANGCQAPLIVEYISEPGPLDATTLSQDVTCYGYSDGSVDLVITGGVSPFQYTWSGPNGFTSIVEDLQGVPAGTYYYNVTDYNGCSLSSPAPGNRNVLVVEPPVVSVTANVTDIDCYGNSNGAIDLIISGIAPLLPDILWSGPNSFYSTSANISGLSSGAYSVDVSNPVTGCTFSLTKNITPISTYDIDTSSTNITCDSAFNGTISITEYNLFNAVYSWVGPNGYTSSLEDIDNLAPGNYQVLINDDNNCPTIYSFDITEPSAISLLSSLSNVSCEGGNNGEISVIASGGTPPYTYIWSNVAPDLPVNSNLSEGPYSLTLLDANNCSFDEDYLMITNPFDTMGVERINVKCKGEFTGGIDILGISGGVAPYSYLWSNGASTQDLIYIGAGSYNVSITDATSCTIDRLVLISEPPQALSAVANSTPTLCFESYDGTATLNISGGVSPYYVEWADQNSLGVNPDSLSQGTYYYQVMDDNDCVFNDDILITGPDSMIVVENIVHLECYNIPTGEVSVDVQFGTGTPPFEYFWTCDTIYSAIADQNYTSNNPHISELFAGIYIVEITDDQGCILAAQFTVDQPEPHFTISQFPSNYSYDTIPTNISCKGKSDGYINLEIDGPYPPFSFLWSNGETTEDIYDLPAGYYTCIITDAKGCDTEIEQPILETEEPVGVDISLTDYSSYGISCYGKNDGGIGVNAYGGVGNYSYEWSVNNSIISGANTDTLGGLYANYYQLKVVDHNGCVYTDTIYVSQPDLLIFNEIEYFPDTCELNKGFASVDIEGGVIDYFYTWRKINDTIGVDYFVDTLSEGVYHLTVEDANECIIETTVDIDNLASPILDFTTNPYRKKYEEQLIDPFVFVDRSQTFEQNIINWNWDFDYNGNFASYDAFDSIVSVSYNEIGEYTVFLSIETEFNCIDTILKNVIVDRYELYVPLAFTPNNDDENEIFIIKGVGVKDMTMIIYSLWGGVIYSESVSIPLGMNVDEILEGWNGKIKDQSDAPIGVYTYFIEVTTIYDDIEKIEGTVRLIR